MNWTRPNDDSQRSYYSKFAGLLGRLTWTRRILQYGLWLPIAAFAMAKLVEGSLSEFMDIPFTAYFAVSFIVTAALHSLLSSTYKTHFFDKWDNDPATNAGWVFPIVLGSLLCFLEYSATADYLQKQIAVPVAVETLGADSLHDARLATLDSRSAAQRQAIEEQAQRQIAIAAPALLAEVTKWEQMKAVTWEDKLHIRRQLKKAQERFYSHPNVTAALGKESANLDSLAAHQGREMAIITAEREQRKGGIMADNSAANAHYIELKSKAKGYAGFFSILSFIIFLYCGRNEVRILTRSGIFPVREFTELEAHGNAWEKAWHVVTDIVRRRWHDALYSMHRTHSRQLGPLKDFDGRLNMEPGDYQTTAKREMNGHRNEPTSVGKPLPRQEN